MAYIEVEVDIEEYLGEVETDRLIEELESRKLDKDNLRELTNIVTMGTSIGILKSLNTISLTDQIKLEEFLETLKK
jgi:hypothetical protein